jgi:PAS domain S-box-containing protein
MTDSAGIGGRWSGTKRRRRLLRTLSSTHRARFGIRTKLLVAFVAVALLTGALGLYAMMAFERMEAGQQTLYGDTFGGTHLLAMWLDEVRDAKSDVWMYALAQDPSGRQRIRTDMASIDARLADLLRQMDEVDLDRTDSEALAGLIQAWSAYADWRDRVVLTAADAGDRAAAREAFRTDGDARSAALDTAAHAFLEKKRESGQAVETSAQAEYEDIRRIALAVTGAAAFLGLLIGYVLSRSIAQAAGQVARAAKGLAIGDLDQDITLRSSDELGQMAAAVREMIAYQQAMARVARRIAGGDLIEDVQPKGPHDVLGTAFQRMVANLRTADAEQLRLLRHAEAAEERSRGLLESAPYAVVVTDRMGCIDLVNRQTEVVFGYDREELLGQPVEILVPERFRAEHRAHRGNYSASPWHRPMAAGFELMGRRKDGTEFPSEISLSPFEMDGQLLVTAAIHDVTEHKRSVEAVRRGSIELARSNAELARSNAELEQFAYTVSHDLKAPLVSIQGFTRQLEDGYANQLEPIGQRYLARIAANAARLSELIANVLAFSRIGRTNPPPEVVDVAEVVRGARDSLQELALRSGATVRIHGPLPIIQSNHEMLDQIVSNLLANAFTYGATPGGRPDVEVGCDDLGERWRLFVRDHGPGIPQGQQQRIFGLFERLSAGNAVNPQGTGVGLSIVRRAAQRLGGDAGVDSAPGAGACFWVDLFKVAPPQSFFDRPGPGEQRPASGLAGGSLASLGRGTPTRAGECTS